MTRIAVTGAQGYIGRHVVASLEKRGHDVLRIIHPASTGTDENVVKLDILNASSQELSTALEGVESVVHLAWQAGFNHNDPSHLQNVMGHIEFINNLASAGIKDISIAGTMHEIGYHVGEVNENTACNPTNPYGIAKNFLRQVCFNLASKNDLSIKWLRMYYITGDDRHSNSIFTKILLAEDEGKKTFPLNSGEMLYDFINVEELGLQIATAALQNEVTGIINCCSGKPVSLRTAVERFIKENGLSIKPEYNVFPSRSYDSPAVWGGSQKIQKIMNLNK
ncbi:NAD(P)-dependent oxidoreductase [Cedecea davisae]|uniref:NAD(P)-dependent oxidoreductase n=1 Tax=Cedecea davisae TaxID=158484 RepID=A0ABS6DIE8_9ENTR|nr:NAD(P)-dependent oxidoreductase [Cedecea davisae]MBU4682985.1 NAD(P)-dependent oxidoreductase [Cedecea davisae]MBU4687916.1 NAD(P)-dependent oxidoreductase [Cedecea davisae]